MTTIDKSLNKLASTYGTGDARIRTTMGITDFWRYREAIRAFATLNLRLRYSNSTLGFLWSLANPLFLMLVFTIAFTVLLPNDTPNYPIFVLSAMLPWNFFQTAMTASISSVTNGRDLISKLPFPREILPLSYVLSELVNFIMAMTAVILFLTVVGIGPGWPVLVIPILTVLLALFTAGVGMFLATVNVRLRDTQEFMSVFMFGWFFVTPIVYPLERIPAERMLLGIQLRTWVQVANPVSAIVTAFRRVLYLHEWPSLLAMGGITLVSLVVFVIGFTVFRMNSAGFAEAI